MQSFEFDQFRFDPDDGRLANRRGGESVHLRPQAGTLLACLLEHPRTVVDRDTLCRAVWGDDAVVDFESGLAALLREIRQALERLDGDPGLIETVPRRGYRLRADVRDAGGGASRPRSPLRPAVWLAAVALLAVAGAAGLALWFGANAPDATGPAESPGPTPANSSSHALAILPLERFGTPDFPPEHAPILLADGLLAALWRAELAGLELIGRAGMRPYAGRDDVAAAVARDLDVDVLIEGNIRAEDGNWRVAIRLLAIPPGRVVWSRTFEGRDPALPVSDIARRTVEQLQRDWPRIRAELDAE